MTEIPVPLEAFGFLITLAVFVSGGLVYSLLGYWKAIRRSINGSVPFDLAKLKTGGILGVMLGITATVYSVYNGDSYIVVTTVQGFITAVGGSIGIIYTVDKILLGSNTNIKLGVKNPFAKESKLSGDSMQRYDGLVEKDRVAVEKHVPSPEYPEKARQSGTARGGIALVDGVRGEKGESEYVEKSYNSTNDKAMATERGRS